MAVYGGLCNPDDPAAGADISLPSSAVLSEESKMMAYRPHNLVTGLQLRAARTLAGMTQRDLAAPLRVNERAVRFFLMEQNARSKVAETSTFSNGIDWGT
jgi:hypothetical protein